MSNIVSTEKDTAALPQAPVHAGGTFFRLPRAPLDRVVKPADGKAA